MENYSFQKGINQVQVRDIGEVRSKLMEALGLQTTQGLRNRIRGLHSLRVHEKVLIEGIFAEYGITEIWGDA